LNNPFRIVWASNTQRGEGVLYGCGFVVNVESSKSSDWVKIFNMLMSIKKYANLQTALKAIRSRF